MKKLLLIAVLLACTTAMFAARPPEVNAKVLKAFKETFKDVKDVNWYEYDSYYEASFNQATIQNRIRYDADGNIIGTTRYYAPDQLPLNILVKLKKRYEKRTLYYVTEITTDESLTYYITMQDDKHWYTVTSDLNGSFQQTEKFKKAEQ